MIRDCSEVLTQPGRCGCRAAQPRRATLDIIRRAFEAAVIEFIDENGGGPGIRFRKGPQKKR